MFLPFNHNLAEGTVKRPVGAMPLDTVWSLQYARPRKGQPRRLWVKPLRLPKKMFGNLTAAIVFSGLLTKTQQASKSQCKAASQGSLIYAIASRTSGERAGCQVEGGHADTVPHERHEFGQDDAATEDDTA